MTERVYVHIGAYKTGTTFLQTTLHHARPALAEHGVLFPGAGIGPDQTRALKHVLGGVNANGTLIPVTPWNRLTRVVREWPGVAAIVSYEGLSAADRRRAHSLVDGFSFADVHVVLTVRDLARTIPSMWQEMLQGGQTWTWPQYLETVMSPMGRAVPPGRNFWRLQDIPQIGQTWADVVGKHRMHIVTVPPARTPMGVLWTRFCDATGLDPTVAHDVAADELANVHGSLDPAASELMRRINLATEGEMSLATYDHVIKRVLAKQVLAEITTTTRTQIPVTAWSWVASRSHEIADRIASAGYKVHGTLDDLRVDAASPPSARSPHPVDDEQVASVAVAALIGLAARFPSPHAADDGLASGQPDISVSAPTAGSRPASRLLQHAYERLRRGTARQP